MVSHKVSITLVLFFCINLISTNIYASNVGGWSLGGGVAQGASTVYTGTKQIIIDGKDYIKKGTAIVTPTATGVVKVLARGVAGYALSVAVEQLLGAVDWVLDPANNQIRYSEVPKGVTAQCFQVISQQSWKDYAKEREWYGANLNCSGTWINTRNGVQELCASVTGYHAKWQQEQGAVTGLGTSCVPIDANKPEEKTLPLEVVASKVISNAESGDTNAQVATGAAAADIVAEAEADQTGVKARPIAQQLEASSTTKPADEAAAEKANEATGEQTKNPDKPDTTDLKLTFPIFCNWAPTVCEAAQTVISFPKTLTNWWETGKEKAEGWATSISESWTAVKDWVKEEPSKDKEDNVDIEEQDLEEKTVDLNFGSACPAPVVLIDSTFYDQPFKIEYSFNDFCSILSDFVRPVLIAMGAFIAALILGGVKTNE